MNHAIGRVGHIVHLPSVDESAFQQNYQKAWLETSRTIGLLHAFDRSRQVLCKKQKLPSNNETIHQHAKHHVHRPKNRHHELSKRVYFQKWKRRKISNTISGLNDKIDNTKENPMMIMLKKLREKQQANVETVVRDESHKNINQQVTANDPSLTILQREAVNGKTRFIETSGS